MTFYIVLLLLTFQNIFAANVQPRKLLSIRKNRPKLHSDKNSCTKDYTNKYFGTIYTCTCSSKQCTWTYASKDASKDASHMPSRCFADACTCFPDDPYHASPSCSPLTFTIAPRGSPGSRDPNGHCMISRPKNEG